MYLSITFGAGRFADRVLGGGTLVTGVSGFRGAPDEVGDVAGVTLAAGGLVTLRELIGMASRVGEGKLGNPGISSTRTDQSGLSCADRTEMERSKKSSRITSSPRASQKKQNPLRKYF